MRRRGIEALVRGTGSGCKETLKSVSGGVGYQKHRLRLCIRCLPTASPFKAMDRRAARPDSRMRAFLEFLKCRRRLRADAELESRDCCRQLHRHTGAHSLMRRANSVRGKGPGSAKKPGPPTSMCEGVPPQQDAPGQSHTDWVVPAYSSSELISGRPSDARALASVGACSHCLRVRLFL